MEQQDRSLDTQEVIFCSKCGNQESAGSRFCAKCGAPLAGAPFSSSDVREKARTLIQSIDENIDKVAIASVAVAAFGYFVCGIYAGLVAIGLGVYAKRVIEKGLGSRRKLAIAGIWLGTAVAVLAVYNTGLAYGYAVGLEVGRSSGIEAGKQQMVNGILDTIVSILF